MPHEAPRQVLGVPVISARRKVSSFGNSSTVLLGSVGADGKFRFLNSAWEKSLGYRGEELRSLPLRELVPIEVLDAVNLGPMEFGLRCKDGTHKRFLWHRRFDSEMQRMFIAGEEIGAREPKI